MRLRFSWVLLIALAGCSSNVTPFGPGQAVQLDEDEKRLWATSNAELDAVAASGMHYRNPQMQAYIEQVFAKLLAGSERAYLPLEPRILLVDIPVTNATCMPAGDIQIFTGILGRMRNEAQLALLLGHEFTHATHRHAKRRIGKVYSAGAALSYAGLLTSIVSGTLGSGVEKVGGIIAVAAIEGYGRDQEREADRIGLTLAAQAGYDPRAALGLWQAMLDASEKPSRKKNAILFYASHPKMTERVKDGKKLVSSLSPTVLSGATKVGELEYVTVFKDLIFAEADRHVAQGKWELVAGTAEYLERTLPDDPRTMVLSADLARSQENYPAALAAYKQAVSRLPSNAGAHRGLGLVAAKTGEHQMAIQHLERYLQLAPDAPDHAFLTSYVRQLKAE